MRLGACGQEGELAERLANGHWPDASSPELRAHVATCRACQDLVLVKQAFRADRAAAAGAARLEAPGVLWWRAQLRRRNAAIERIGRPILGAQIFALAVSLVGAIAYLAIETRQGFDWPAWLQQIPRALHFEALLPEALMKPQWEVWTVLSVVAMVALMSGVIAYVASEKG
jgi:hypothetical protein